MKVPWLDSEGDTRGNMRKSRSVLTVSPNNVSHISPALHNRLHIAETSLEMGFDHIVLKMLTL